MDNVDILIAWLLGDRNIIQSDIDPELAAMALIQVLNATVKKP